MQKIVTISRSTIFMKGIYMKVSPVQNNNSQSFGMAFKLKGAGAKKLATFLEEANPATNKHVMEDLITPIDSLHTRVVYDGKDVLTLGVPVSEHCPAAIPGINNRSLLYILDNGEHVYRVEYKEPQKIRNFSEAHPLLQKLFNAREIAKDIDAKVSKKIYKIQKAAEKEARIAEKTKKLQDLFG